MPTYRRRPAVRSAHAPPLDAVLIRLLSATAAATAAAAVALGCAAAARAEAVVVASTAPAYTLGQVVPDGSAVQVPDGASAVFLFSSGRTVRVRGPYEGDIDKAPERDARAGSSVKANDRFVQSDLGAARALGNPLDKAVERAFTIDPAVSGTYCVKAGSPPALRRPTQANPQPIVLQDVGRGVSANVTWAGAAVPWPRELALSDGTEIRVSGTDGAPRTLRFRQVDAAPGGSAALAVRMAAAGCTNQAGLVLSSLRDATVPLDLYLSADRSSVRAGEDVRLLLQTNRDAHVYCWLRNARAQLIPVFPSGSASAVVEGSAPRTLPLRAADAPGDAEVRCVASSRNLDAELPGRGEAFRPLDDTTVAALDRALSRLRDADLASSQIIVRIR